MKDPALTWQMGTSAQEIDADGRLAAGQQLSIMLLKNAYLLRCAASFVTAAYAKYASFLRICAPCIEAFLNSLCDKVFFNSLLLQRQYAIRCTRRLLRPTS